MIRTEEQPLAANVLTVSSVSTTVRRERQQSGSQFD